MSDQDLQNVTDEEMDAFLNWLFGPGKGDDETDRAADTVHAVKPLYMGDDGPIRRTKSTQSRHYKKRA